MKGGLQHILRFFALTTLLLAIVAGTSMQYAEAAPVKQKAKTEQKKDGSTSDQQLRAATLIATVPGATVLDQNPFEVVFYAVQHPVIIRQYTHTDFTPETLSYFRTLFHSSIVTNAP